MHPSRALRFAWLPLFLLACALPARAQTSSDWQQVKYDMFVELDPATHGMTGVQELRYTNASPNTLREVYYHLYFNAFNPNSMMAERNRDLPDPDGRVVPRIFELDESEIGYHEIETLTQDGQPVASFDVTDTILRVRLATPLAPGRTTTLRMTYRSQVPLQTRRNGRDSREGIAYSMAQWYPKLAAYDVSGWHTDPYVGREFYAPYGTFDVRITIPADHVLGATGLLQNGDEVGHGYQSDTTRVYANSPDTTNTWRFIAEDVHDFAWVADPDYLHDVIPDTLGGKPVTYHVLYQPDVAEVWANQKTWIPTLMGCFSDQLGAYAYPQITVAQAGDGGMEYPMINFNTGRRSERSLLGVTSHELAHEWFYAMVGFNEAEYAWPDEGFVSFSSSNAIACLRGKGDAERRGNHGGSVRSVLLSRELGFGDRLNTSADWFVRNSGYSVSAYSGGQAFLHLLGDVIGDSLRDQFLRELVERYTFSHATPERMEALAEEISGVQLDWFFEQVLDGDWDHDYAVEDLETTSTPDGWQTKLEIDREGRMVMPQTVRFALEDGSTYDVIVPLGIMHGAKPIADSMGTVAAPWMWTSREYDLDVLLPAKPLSATIDPDARQPDRNRLDNSTASPIDARFLQPARASWNDYSVGWRPLATYAADYGPGIGLRAEGGYWLGRHNAKAMVTVWPEQLDGEAPELQRQVERERDASWFEAIDYELAYQSSLGRRSPGTTVGISTRKHIGTLHSRAFVRYAFGPAPGIGDTRGALTLSVDMVASPWERVFAPYCDSQPCYVSTASSLGLANDLTATLRYDAGGRDGDVSIALDIGGRVGSRYLTVNRFSPVSPFYAGTKLTVTLDKRATWGPLRGRAGLMGGIGARNMAFYRHFKLGQPSTLETWSHDAARTGLAAADEHYSFDQGNVFVPIPGGPDIVRREASYKKPLLLALSTYGPVGYSQIDNLLLWEYAGTRTLAGSLELGTGSLFDPLPVTVHAFSGAAYLPWFYNSLGEEDDDFYGSEPFFHADHFFADVGVGARLVVGDIPLVRRWAAQSDILNDLSVVFKVPFYVYKPELDFLGDFFGPDGLVERDNFERSGDDFAFRYLIGIEVRP